MQNDKNNNKLIDTSDSIELSISAIDNFSEETMDSLYSEAILLPTVLATLKYINECIETGLILPYYDDMDNKLWHSKPKALDIYITDLTEGQELNLESRGKDYATNILSYPSEIPDSVLELMQALPLGELIICHEVVVREAGEQNKTIAQHLTHLLIHGVLHLLGFDHELGQAEQDEMEQFEIEILKGLGLPNPYL